MSNVKIFLNFLKEKIVYAVLFLLCTAVQCLVLWLDDTDTGIVLYTYLLWLVVFLVYAIFDYMKYYKSHRLLEDAKNQILVSMEKFPMPSGLIQNDYNELLKLLYDDKAQQLNGASIKYRDTVDYFTVWAHQIKTPIAAMRLILQSNETPENAELELELMRIEQYVEMVLCYIRLDSKNSDYVIRTTDIDRVIKQVLRKNAKQFIRRRITLRYDGVDFTAVTDEKWLAFVLEQILTNSIKYIGKDGGTIKIYREGEKQLVIEDDGIGIAAEDIPRIFDRGFTGYNGRSDKKATGIGLYLCKRILTGLGHGISVESTEGVGTKMILDLESKNIDFRD